MEFWQSLYDGWIAEQPFFILRAALSMAPPVAFGLIISFVFGKITAAKIIGNRYASKVIALSIMFSLYGTLLGFILGNSKESVARESLSSLVAIVSALFGYFIAKELPGRLKSMIPTAISCFLLSTMFTALYFSYFTK